MVWSNCGHNSTAARLRILERDGYRCTHCGDTQGPFEVDHIDNTRGPHYDLDANKQTLCVACHTRKTRAEEQRGRQRHYARRRLPQKPHPGLIR